MQACSGRSLQALGALSARVNLTDAAGCVCAAVSDHRADQDSAPINVQGFRKICRALAIVLCGVSGCWLLVDAGFKGPAEYQLPVAAGLLIFAAGLALSWFWSPLG